MAEAVFLSSAERRSEHHAVAPRPGEPVADNQASRPGPVLRSLRPSQVPVQPATPPSVPSVLRGPGQPLATTLKEEMEGRLGADLSKVRVHVGAEARASAAALGASAYTSGDDVVVGDGGADKHTLAHELTHVIQQRSGPVAGTVSRDGLRLSDPSDPFERHAAATASRVMARPAGPRAAPGDIHGPARRRPPARSTSAVPVVQRHPGKEKLKGSHKASDHVSPEDQREHEKLAQDRFSKMTSEELLLHLGGTEALVDVPLEDLPPELQAWIRSIRKYLTDLEQALATSKGGTDRGNIEKTFRDRLKEGARSWHDDEHGKIPPPKAEGLSDRAGFFQRWRQDDAFLGKDVPAKQAKKEFSGQKYPYREYTATGWRQADQIGRLIYDPIDDQFYLTLSHYNEERYFRIVCPPRPAVGAPQGPSAAVVSEAEIDTWLYQAWSGLSGELAKLGLGGKGAAAVPPSKDALRCLMELHRLRGLYVAAYEGARGEVAAKQAKKKKAETIKAKLEEKVNPKGGKGSKGSQKSKQEAKATEEKPGEEISSFIWLGATFYVSSVAGYVGYHDGKKYQWPRYDGTKIGAVAALFRQCVDRGWVIADEATSLMLAALVVETVRHPVASVEALFSVIERSPFPSDMQAFGTALPMSAGGTFSTGSVASGVIKQETALSRQVLSHVLGNITQSQLNAKAQELGRDGFIAQVMEWLSLGLSEPERQAKARSKIRWSEESTWDLKREVESTRGGMEISPGQPEGSRAKEQVEEQPLSPEMIAFLEALTKVSHARPQEAFTEQELAELEELMYTESGELAKEGEEAPAVEGRKAPAEESRVGFPSRLSSLPGYFLYLLYLLYSLFGRSATPAEENKESVQENPLLRPGRPAVPAKKSKEEQPSTTPRRTRGYPANAFKVIPNPGGGDCLFHALAGETLSDDELAEVRKEVAHERRGMPPSAATNANNIMAALVQTGHRDIAAQFRGIDEVPNDVYAQMQAIPGMFAGDNEIVQWCMYQSANGHLQEVTVVDADGTLSVFSATGRRQITVTRENRLAKAQESIKTTGIGLYKTPGHYERIQEFT